MKTALLTDLRSIEVKDLSSLMLQARFAIEVFGHCSIEKQRVIDLLNVGSYQTPRERDAQALAWITEEAEERDLELKVGVLSFSLKPKPMKRERTDYVIAQSTLPAKKTYQKKLRQAMN